MSYDRQIDQVCPHLVVEEALFLSSDNRTIRPIRPIASTASVVVLLDHAIPVPSMGVTCSGQVTGAKDGPFNITTGVNDTFVLKVNQRPAQKATLPSAFQVGIGHIVQILNQQVAGVSFAAVGNKLSVQTTDSGLGASLLFTSDSTAAPVFGLNTNREYRGKQVVPGWTIITDPTADPSFPERLILFDLPLRGGSEFVEINYTTVSKQCRRCGGSQVENDWNYAKDGKIITVSDEALLIQELQKLFYTSLASNPFHSWYGTELLEMIGKKLTAGGFIQNLIVSDIYTAFDRWQQIKTGQEQKVGQIVTDEEFPFRLLSVGLQQSTQDPTVIFVDITVQNRSLKPIVLTRGLKVPLPHDLLGSTQQQGIIRQSLSNFVLAG